MYRYDGEDAEPEAAQPAPAPIQTDVGSAAPSADISNHETALQQQQQHDFEDDVKPFDPSAEDMDGVVKQEYNPNFGGGYDPPESRQQVRLKDDG